MRINHRLLLVFCILSGTVSFDTWAVSAFSKYGQIQNVQSYSSNPFWTPDAPYNQRLPTPVYATGTDIETSDCLRVTTNLIAAQCATRNNCITTRLSDIRPTLITQMSRMPGGNYATACAGYLDTAFSDYVKQYANAGANTGNSTFPSATIPNPNAQETTFTDPFAPKTPQWATDAQQRKQELQNLKDASDTETPGLNTAAFPTTYADVSLSERMQNAAEGYAPYKGKTAYAPIKVTKGSQYNTQANNNTSNNAGNTKPDKPGKSEQKPPQLTNNELETIPGEILFIL